MLYLTTPKQLDEYIDKIVLDVKDIIISIRPSPELISVTNKVYKHDVKNNAEITFDLSEKLTSDWFRANLEICFEVKPSFMNIKSEYLVALLFMSKVFESKTLLEVIQELYTANISWEHLPVVEWAVSKNNTVIANSNTVLFYGGDYKLLNPAAGLFYSPFNLNLFLKDYTVENPFSIFFMTNKKSFNHWKIRTDENRQHKRNINAVFMDVNTEQGYCNMPCRKAYPGLKFATFCSISDRTIRIPLLEGHKCIGNTQLFDYPVIPVSVLDATLINDGLERTQFIFSKNLDLNFSFIGVEK